LIWAVKHFPALRHIGLTCNIMFIVMTFGTVAQKNFATAHIMWWYVLIFATLGALNFADRYSLGSHKKIARYRHQ
jgi:hypothetical protein